MDEQGRAQPKLVEFIPTEIENVLIVKPHVFGDDRGFLTETYSERNWALEGFRASFVQDNLSLSSKGTLRGMHYQLEPHAMGKLVRAVTGAVFDVGVDLRRGSPTFGRWVGRTLRAEDHAALWLPPGFAHGFVALEDHTLVYYKCTEFYTPEAEASLAYNDPDVGIEWPIEPTSISRKDLGAPRLKDAKYNFVY